MSSFPLANGKNYFLGKLNLGIEIFSFEIVFLFNEVESIKEGMESRLPTFYNDSNQGDCIYCTGDCLVI